MELGSGRRSGDSRGKAIASVIPLTSRKRAEFTTTVPGKGVECWQWMTENVWGHAPGLASELLLPNLPISGEILFTLAFSATGDLQAQRIVPPTEPSTVPHIGGLVVDGVFLVFKKSPIRILTRPEPDLQKMTDQIQSLSG